MGQYQDGGQCPDYTRPNDQKQWESDSQAVAYAQTEKVTRFSNIFPRKGCTKGTLAQPFLF
jgi:hypothetical protein